MADEIKKYPKGHFTGKWIAIGIALFSGVGVSLSVSTGNHGLIGIGPAIGVAMGAAIGQSVENKYAQKGLIRPLNEKELNQRRKAAWIGFIVLAFGLFVLLYFLLNK